MADSGNRKVTAYSCRSSSTSKTEKIGVSLNSIVAFAIWSKENNVKRFYLKEINNLCKSNLTSFGIEPLRNVK